MVVKWKEFTLDPDSTDCETSGSCAVVELATSNVFQGQTVETTGSFAIVDGTVLWFTACR